MAAFEGSEAVHDRVPRLDEGVERVLRRCGSKADLLLEFAVSRFKCTDPLFLLTEARQSAQFLVEPLTVLSRPLLAVLQQLDAHCVHCSPLGRLRIQSIALSGSSVEGFMPVAAMGGAEGVTSGSDKDFMLQLGPVNLEEDIVHTNTRKAIAGSPTADQRSSRQQDDNTPPRLRVVPTSIPGFVLLYQKRQEQCTHRNEHLFSGESVRQLINRFCRVQLPRARELAGSGPATSVSSVPSSSFDGFDMVPCLRASWWPSDEFFRRSRARNWPPAAVRDDIQRFGIHLVPVGAKCSSTELHEFRLSFSRAEVATAWHLLPPQRNSLVALKFCRTALGSEGKPLKTYFMKTALFWLCQDLDAIEWTSIKKGICMILDYLEKAIEARYLGCFFWSEINLFGRSSSTDLAEMRQAIMLLRRNMIRLLAHELTIHIECSLVPIILREPSQTLSERQLRVCLGRELVVFAVLQGLIDVSAPVKHSDALLISTLLRSSSTAELACILHKHQQQDLLFLAITAAPADVVERCRLTSLNDVMFSWDASPLVGLLTMGDLRLLLGDPGAVSSWLKVNRRLPADLRSPRELANLLLNPSLLAEALRESVPRKWASMQRRIQGNPHVPRKRTSFEDARRQELDWWDRSATLPTFETQSAQRLYRQFKEKARLFLNDPHTVAESARIRRCLLDPWELRQFVFADPK